MPGSRNGLKRAHSQKASVIKQSRFTAIVDAQENRCWYCDTKMSGDASREHLLSQCLGGTDTDPPNNLKAAHRDCNTAVGHLSVVDKYRLREIGRSEGREEMIRVALQMRRADARLAFSIPNKHKHKGKSRSNAYWRKLGLTEKPDWWDT